jgi:aminotransferase
MKYDAIIMGAGHNGLIAASYLAKAGKSVLMLEAADEIGGATASVKAFKEYEARLSRYSYLVALLPDQIVQDLGLNFETLSRDVSSFTPYQKDGKDYGLHISRIWDKETEDSFKELTGSDLEGIAKLAIEHDLIVMTDEIYSELRYDDTEPHLSIASLPGMKERTILLHGFSKAFAMTGFRLGYACAPQPIIEAMMKIHQYAMLCAPIMSQNAAIEALENGQPAMLEMRNSYHQRRDFLVKRLNEIGLDCHTPGGAFYVFPDIRSSGLTSKEFAMRLLEEENVACVPGSAFGPSGEGFLRCCYATAFDDIRTATDRMERFVGRLKKR